AQQIRYRAKRFDLHLQIADFFVLPTEYIAPNRIPGNAIIEANRFGCREEHLRNHDFRRLDMVAPDLIHAHDNSFLFAPVLTLDHQYWDAIDQKDDVLPCAVSAVVEIEFFRDFIDVSPIVLRAG